VVSHQLAALCCGIHHIITVSDDTLPVARWRARLRVCSGVYFYSPSDVCAV